MRMTRQRLDFIQEYIGANDFAKILEIFGHVDVLRKPAVLYLLHSLFAKE